MKKELEKKYNESLEFWDSALKSEEAEFADVNPESDWRELGSSSLLEILDHMECLDNVLDYGCGSGWADVFLAKKGSKNIHAVDVSENGVETAKLYAKSMKTNEQIKFEHVSTEWLSMQAAEGYDHAICINVVDVVPDEVSQSIIEGLANVVKAGGTVMIGMNPCFDADYGVSKEGIKWEGNYLICDGILRVNNHTDEEWIAIINKFFELEKIEYYRMDMEKEGTKRRLFFPLSPYLTKL